jgi:glyoxylase-like metal-dependent hydrolase (beta-lactamase superfamily II)
MEIFNVGNKSVNRYLLVSDTHRLLIDSGFPGSLHELGRALRQTGGGLRDIDYLIVTHFHIDHAGAVQELKNEGVQFLLFPVQQAYLAPMELMAAHKWSYLPLSLSDNIVMPLSETRTFLKGISIDGEVIATRGHSDDSVSVLLDTGEVFTGDLTAAFLVTDEMEVSAESWRRIRQSGGRTVYPGHGKEYVL